MWANLHLLFWLSMIPFATSWLSVNHHAAWPTAAYGLVMLMAAISYFILQAVIVEDRGPDSDLARSLGRDWKGKISLACYFVGIGSAFIAPLLSHALFVLVALIWIVPDRRIR